MPSATIYAKMHREFLKQNHPETYQSLVESGELNKHAARVGKTAVDLFETLSAQMATSKTLPENYMELVEALEAIPGTVEEIVLNDVVHNPAP